MTLKSSPEKDKAAEQQKVCSTEKDSPLEVPVEEAYKEDEDDDLIFRKNEHSMVIRQDYA